MAHALSAQACATKLASDLQHATLASETDWAQLSGRKCETKVYLGKMSDRGCGMRVSRLDFEIMSD
jgi:hypothetical protein